ncbi:mutator type transposase, partial [Tanacetum coccineum]
IGYNHGYLLKGRKVLVVPGGERIDTEDQESGTQFPRELNVEKVEVAGPKSIDDVAANKMEDGEKVGPTMDFNKREDYSSCSKCENKNRPEGIMGQANHCVDKINVGPNKECVSGPDNVILDRSDHKTDGVENHNQGRVETDKHQEEVKEKNIQVEIVDESEQSSRSRSRTGKKRKMSPGGSFVREEKEKEVIDNGKIISQRRFHQVAARRRKRRSTSTKIDGVDSDEYKSNNGYKSASNNVGEEKDESGMESVCLLNLRKIRGSINGVGQQRFSGNNACGGERFVAVKGTCRGVDGEIIIANVYEAHCSNQKIEVWNKISALMETVDGGWCLFGDFNEVRVPDDRLTSEFNKRDADNFNDFIRKNDLVVIPLGGRRFTRKLSNHCPIILKDMEYDFGPKPFRVFDAWLTDGDIDNVFRSASNKPVRSTRVDCIVRDKLKNVKDGLKGWSKEKRELSYHVIDKRKKDATMWELEAKKRVLNNVEMDLWLKARKEWIKKENEQVGILRQKTRIKWDIEGDENSKYFHTVIRRRNNKNNIRGLMIDGVWCEEPDRKKEEVLSVEDSCSLEAPFTENEVWEAVCGCGSDKAPGPDGFNFKYIKHFWEVIKTDIVAAARWFWEKGEFLKGCNASFVTLIPKVADPLGLGDYRPISLNALMKEAVLRNIFKVFKVGDDELMVPSVVISTLERIRKNFFWGGLGGAKKLHWVKWENVVSSFGEGGLNIGSLKTKNLSLLGKWWWRFRIEKDALWRKVIKSIYGMEGSWGGVGSRYQGGEVWVVIIKVGKNLDMLEGGFVSHFVKVVGDGLDTSFWLDKWVGEIRFCDRFSRLFHRETSKDVVVGLKGTTVRIDVQQEPNPESLTRTFRRVYVCLGALKQGFRACGREILGLDGCFMSGPWPGQILTAVGVDANNGIYPVAYAIVEAESKASWCWFLNLLGEDLGTVLIPSLTLTVHKDLYKPLQVCFQVLNTAKATSEGEFKKKMGELKSFNSDAYDWLMKIPLEQWNRAHFSVGVGILEQWVHAAYRLETWAHVYSFKVNPCNRRDMWPVVESRTVIIPPLYKPLVDRPPKKRKKSNDKIASQSASSGKLSRKGKSVSYGKCGNVDHNRKGCRGQGGGSSQAGARKVSGQAVGSRKFSGQAAGARNVSSQAAGARKASSQPSAA